MPRERANRNEVLLYFLCSGNPDNELHSMEIELNSDIKCKQLLPEKFLEDMFCIESMLGSKQECQVTFLISFAHPLSGFKFFFFNFFLCVFMSYPQLRVWNVKSG